ncbi:hypothetical protein P7C71_g1867, partial [Lecanoromycetidae sp. Uapishka_2]
MTGVNFDSEKDIPSLAGRVVFVTGGKPGHRPLDPVLTIETRHILYASELARRYPNITPTSVHPGVINTGL